jgi:NitT/TauT family transport system ATP-binding protein
MVTITRKKSSSNLRIIMNTPIITAKNITKVFPRKDGRRRVEVLKGIDLSIYEGEFVILLGPSGSGKSTLLRIISGLDKQTSGSVVYGDKFDSSRMSFVFQDFGVLPWLTVYENVELNLLTQKLSEKESQNEINTILEKFGLTAFKNNFPYELSGGMKQRVGLARAFVLKPDIIFLDEPFSELDFITVENLREILLGLWKEQKTTVVMVSHNIEEAVLLADRIVLFSARPSMIKACVENNIARPRIARSAEVFKMEDEIKVKFRG